MVQLVPTGPKIIYGFVLKKFQKGNFFGHPVCAPHQTMLQNWPNSSYKEALGDPILQEELPEEKKKPPYSYASLIRLAIINSESQKVFLHFLNLTQFLRKIGSNGQLYCHQLQPC